MPTHADTPTSPTRRWPLVVAIAAVAVALVLAGVVVALVLTRPDPATPAAQTSPAPSSTGDVRGEQACKELEELENSEIDAYTYRDNLLRIAGFGRQATNEDVREQSQILYDLVNVPRDQWDVSRMIDAEQQSLNLVRACDDANYAF